MFKEINNWFKDSSRTFQYVFIMFLFSVVFFICNGINLDASEIQVTVKNQNGDTVSKSVYQKGYQVSVNFLSDSLDEVTSPSPTSQIPLSLDTNSFSTIADIVKVGKRIEDGEKLDIDTISSLIVPVRDILNRNNPETIISIIQNVKDLFKSEKKEKVVPVEEEEKQTLREHDLDGYNLSSLRPIYVNEENLLKAPVNIHVIDENIKHLRWTEPEGFKKTKKKNGHGFFVVAIKGNASIHEPELHASHGASDDFYKIKVKPSGADKYFIVWTDFEGQHTGRVYGRSKVMEIKK